MTRRLAVLPLVLGLACFSGCGGPAEDPPASEAPGERVQFHLNLDRSGVLRASIDDFEGVLENQDAAESLRSLAVRVARRERGSVGGTPQGRGRRHLRPSRAGGWR